MTSSVEIRTRPPSQAANQKDPHLTWWGNLFEGNLAMCALGLFANKLTAVMNDRHISVKYTCKILVSSCTELEMLMKRICYFQDAAHPRATFPRCRLSTLTHRRKTTLRCAELSEYHRLRGLPPALKQKLLWILAVEEATAAAALVAMEILGWVLALLSSS